MTETTLGEKTVFTGCDLGNVSQEVLKFMKSSFEATCDNVIKIQDLNEKMLRDALDNGKEVQADAVLMVNDFIENAKKGRDEYRKSVEEGFKKLEEIVKTAK